MPDSPSETSSPQASTGPGASPQSSVETHLRSGAASRVFLLLDADVQNQIIAKVQHLPAAEQSQLLARLRTMSFEDLLALVQVPMRDGPVAVPQSYTVKKGDSLSKIAQAKGVNLAALIAANPQIKNPDLIHPNQVITLPAT